MTKPLLKLENFQVHFHGLTGTITPVKGVDLTINEGEIVGLVGESGCGKSVTSQSVLRLLEHTANLSYEGQVNFQGRNILTLNRHQLRQLRGKDIAIIFQEPMVSLNPVFTIGNQLEEVLLEHTPLTKKQRHHRVLELLGLMEIPDPSRCAKQYPHELSGGMQQRVMIAMALACVPKLLIADEPTTALDVTTQSQIIKLLQKLNQELGMAILFITHDLGLVADICHRAEVMYLGEIVETATGKDLFQTPKHPYTQGLLASLPSLQTPPKTALPVIKGVVPSLTTPITGCAFASRCPYATQKCREVVPPTRQVSPTATSKCHYDIIGGRPHEAHT